jgi:hypothetical protein
MFSRKALLIFVSALLVLGLNTACGLSFLQAPTPTNTPAPTSTKTPLPTATQTPLPTSTNTPTITPDLKATQSAQNEQAVKNILTGLELDADTGHLAWYQDEPVSINLQGPSWDFKTFDDKFNASDFVLYTELTWKTDSWPVCGVFFRSDDRGGEGNTYVLQALRFAGLPAWDIEYYKDGNYVTTITGDVKYTKYLKNDDGSVNKLLLVAVENQFRVWVNGNYEGQYYDWSKKLTDGNISFLASNNAGNTKCTFDNSWVWSYK